MEPKSPQFTPYDFLGYLVPGLALAAIVDLSIAFHVANLGLSYTSITLRYSSIPWTGAIPLILISYYLGHLVSFVSAMTIERHSKWRYGHPMRFLRAKSDDPSPRYFDTGGGSPVFSKILRGLTASAIAPISLFECPLFWCKIIGNYVRPLGPDLQDAVDSAMNRLSKDAGIKLNASQEYPAEFERIAIHYALETAPAHVYTLRNYVVIYGFLRSMTLMMVLAVWLFSFHATYSSCHAGHGFLHSGCVFLLTFCVGGLICSISYGSFLKFWSRYNKEALMAVITVLLKDKHGMKATSPSSENSEHA